MDRNYTPKLKELYETKGKELLLKELGLKNKMMLPKLVKVVLTMGDRNVVADPKLIETIYNDLYLIAGQKPVVTKAKKAIAGFKLKQGMPLACKVTLRKRMMYDFIYRLVNIALPRVRDFRGFSSSQFDGKGGFAFGIKEHVVFPEINYDHVDKIRGMNVVVLTSSKTPQDAKALLEFFGFPFEN